MPSLEEDSVASEQVLLEVTKANDIMQVIQDQGMSQPQAALHILSNGVDTLKAALANHVPMYFAEATPVEAEGILSSIFARAAAERESVQVSYGRCVENLVAITRDKWPQLLSALFEPLTTTAGAVTSVAALDAWSAAVARWVEALPPPARRDIVWPWVRAECAAPTPVRRMLACRVFSATLECDDVAAADGLWRDVARLRGDTTADVALAFIDALATLREVGGVAMHRIVVLPLLMDLVCHRSDAVAARVFVQLLESSCAMEQMARCGTATGPHDHLMASSSSDLFPLPPKADTVHTATQRVVWTLLAGYLLNEPPVVVEYAVVENIGRLAYATGFLRETIDTGSASPTEKDRGDAIVADYVTRAARSPNVAVRKRIAYNFPGLLMAFERDAPKSTVHLTSLHSMLCTDPCDAVRDQIAASYHEVVRIALPKYPKALDNFLALLEDPFPSVKDKMFGKTPRILDVILGRANRSSAKWKSVAKSLLRPMAEYASVASADWRKLLRLFHLFDSLVSAVPPPSCTRRTYRCCCNRSCSALRRSSTRPPSTS
jgi:hypothetical protein